MCYFSACLVGLLGCLWLDADWWCLLVCCYVVRCFGCLCVVVGLLLLLAAWCGCWLGSVRLCDVVLIGLGCIV